LGTGAQKLYSADAHSHLLYNQNQSKLGMEEASALPATVRIQEGIGFGMELLQAGFTSVRDLGNSGQYLDLQLKKIFERQKPVPRMLVSGPIISPPGGQFNNPPGAISLFNKPGIQNSARCRRCV
jgi:imidazolonepropionase-like amidohydrolase